MFWTQEIPEGDIQKSEKYIYIVINTNWASLVAQMIESACDVRHLGLIPGEADGNPFLYSCLENHMNKGAWQATFHGVTESRTQLIDQHSQLQRALISIQILAS